MSTTSVTLKQPRVLADVLPKSLTTDISLVVGAAVLVGILAQISIPLGFTPVPITGQTFGVLLAGSVLGWRRASLSMGFYVLAGMAGVPWFAQHTHGMSMPTFGYLIGFVFAGTLLGALAARGNDRNVARAAISMLLAEAVIYIFGVTWLAHDIHVSLATGINLGMRPFIWGDIIKAGIAGLAIPAVWRFVDKADKSKSE
jgi:biotin transport system substrate-specific component